MNEELELNLDDLDQIEASEDNRLKVKNRFQQLANDKKALAQEKEAEIAKNKELERERDFFKGFSGQLTKYPKATDHQDKIWEKVRAGYELDDAIVSVLNKEGQLTEQKIEQPIEQPKIEPTVQPIQAEGGSSPTIVTEGNKSVSDMTTSEKLEALKQLEKEGAISMGN